MKTVSNLLLQNIIDFEKSTIKAFKEKEAALFTEYFAKNYIGVESLKSHS